MTNDLPSSHVPHASRIEPNLAAASRAIETSAVLITRVTRDVDSRELLAIMGRASRHIQESQSCLRRLQLVLDSNRGVLGLVQQGDAKADAAFRRFIGTLSHTP